MKLKLLSSVKQGLERRKETPPCVDRLVGRRQEGQNETQWSVDSSRHMTVVSGQISSQTGRCLTRWKISNVRCIRYDRRSLMWTENPSVCCF